MANGGKRPGAGRKPNKIEEDVKTAIKNALAESGEDALQIIWKKVIEQAQKGSEKHIQILLNYYYGKPVDNVNIQGGLTINFTRKVVKWYRKSILSYN